MDATYEEKCTDNDYTVPDALLKQTRPQLFDKEDKFIGATKTINVAVFSKLNLDELNELQPHLYLIPGARPRCMGSKCQGMTNAKYIEKLEKKNGKWLDFTSFNLT